MFAEDDLPSLAEATNSVDALVSDGLDDSLGGAGGGRTSQTPGHLEGSQYSAPPGLMPPSHAPSRPPPGFETRNEAPSAPEGSTAVAKPVRQSGQASQPVLIDEEFPALGAPKPAKEKHIVPAVPKLPLPKVTAQVKKGNEKQPEKDEQATDSRRTSVDRTVEADSRDVDKEEPSNTAASTPRGPKTLRVVPTSKNEPPVIPSPVATRGISAMQRPETPASEVFSDSASIISASVSASRAGSPPPSKVGSAAVRTTTKSQQRKQRKEALKQETKTIAEAHAAAPADHAPILGRKKKQKKENPAKEKPVKEKPVKDKPAKDEPVKEEPAKEEPPKEEPATKGSAPTPEESTVPTPPAEESKVAKSQSQDKTPEAASEAASQPKKGSKASKKGKDKAIKPASPEPVAAPEPAQASPKEDDEEEEEEEGNPPSGPASIFEEIRGSLWTSALEHLQLLKPLARGARLNNSTQATSTPKKTGYCKDNSCKCGEIQPEDISALRAGGAVRKQFHVDGSRMLITPNGDCVRGLTAEEEEDFLSLQDAIAETAEHPGAFVAPRHQSGTGAFSLIKGRAVPNGRPNIFPATAKPQAQDPIGKLQREDALCYINQYVLPRLNIGMNHGAAGAGKGGVSSPSRDAAAASLNSLAPYFYGPDAAAGVGIYSSASDGGSTPRSMHECNSPGGADEYAKGSSGGVGSLPLMTVEEAETALAAARKETEKLEKGLNAVIRRNKRLLVGGGN